MIGKFIKNCYNGDITLWIFQGSTKLDYDDLEQGSRKRLLQNSGDQVIWVKEYEQLLNYIIHVGCQVS